MKIKLEFDIKNSGALLENLLGLFNVDLSTPASIIPLPVILVNGPLKPGLSATKLATTIITRQTEALEQQNNTLTAGGISEAMEFIRCQEIVKAIQTEMKVDVASIDPLSVMNQGYGQAY